MATVTKIDKNKLLYLHNEIIMAEKINEQELEPILQESIARYTGRYIPKYNTSYDIVLNEIYPIIQYNLPSIFFRNPTVYLKPRSKYYIASRMDPISEKRVQVQLDSQKSAKTQEHILNYTMSEISYKDETRKVLLDALLFPHAVLWHGYKGDFGMTEEQSILIKDDNVFVQRINPLNHIFDPKVNTSNISEAQWQGRILYIPKDDIIEDDKLNVTSKLKGIKGFGQKVGSKDQNNYMSTGGQDSQRISSYKKSLLSYTSKQFQESSGAEFIKVYEIFLRPSKKEKREGGKGWILLLTDSQDEPLRVSPWSIKSDEFPGKILQFNELNDSLFGLEDIATYKHIADQKNIIVNLQLRNAQENSKVWVGIAKDATNEEDMTKIRRGDQTIITFDGDVSPSQRMFVASPGGQASSELYLIDQRIQRNLEEKSGVSELKKGTAPHSGEESATSVRARTAGSTARPAYRQDIMADFLRSSVHYLNQLLKQFTPVKEAVRISGTLDIEWSENPTKEELQAPTDVTIDVYSMLPEDPQTELATLNTVLSLMVRGVTEPLVKQKLQEEGKTINLAPVIEQILYRLKIRNPEIFRNIKPEESEGFVSVQQIKEARENVNAALTGEQPPFPPQPNDDHRAKLEVYTSMQQILQAAGQVSEMLDQLAQAHSAILQEIESQQGQSGQQVNLSKLSIQTV